jgi:hypothetical protein
MAGCESPKAGAIMAVDDYRRALRSPYWRALRKRLLPKDNACSNCGQCQHVLELHHKTYERLGQELDDDVVFLCPLCHTEADLARVADYRSNGPSMPDWKPFAEVFQSKYDPALVNRAINRLEHGDIAHTKYGARVALRPDLDDNREATGYKAYWPEHGCLCYYNKANHVCSHRIAVEIFREGVVTPIEVRLTIEELDGVPPVLARRRDKELTPPIEVIDEVSILHALWYSQKIYMAPGVCHCSFCQDTYNAGHA